MLFALQVLSYSRGGRVAIEPPQSHRDVHDLSSSKDPDILIFPSKRQRHPGIVFLVSLASV
jgi:hypothetical protein